MGYLVGAAIGIGILISVALFEIVDLLRNIHDELTKIRKGDKW